MRYLYFAKGFLAIILITSPLHVLAQCNECPNPEQVNTLQNTTEEATTCDTYITDSKSGMTLQYIEDRITEQVKELFANEGDLQNITVTTANGVVFLSGSARSQDEIDKAAGLAASVPCVTEVDTSKFYVQ